MNDGDEWKERSVEEEPAICVRLSGKRMSRYMRNSRRGPTMGPRAIKGILVERCVVQLLHIGYCETECDDGEDSMGTKKWESETEETRPRSPAVLGRHNCCEAWE